MKAMKLFQSLNCLVVVIGMMISFPLVAQDCTVAKIEIKGTYTGDCKKGLANGKGKSVGTDSYEGSFRSGLPEGYGTYRWSNGSEYTGEFSKGLKQGKGKLLIKRAGKEDSLVVGYWKKDVFAGVNEHNYRIINKSKAVNEIEVEYKTDPYNKITFFITNTSGGASTFDDKELPKFKVDEVRAMTGGYGRLFVNDNHVKKTESIIEDVRFPIRMKAIIGAEEIEIEFFEAGTYILNVRIND
jgi:hypothetical protein